MTIDLKTEKKAPWAFELGLTGLGLGLGGLGTKGLGLGLDNLEIPGNSQIDDLLTEHGRLCGHVGGIII